MGTFQNISSIFSDIASALRSKMGVADTFRPDQMAGAVNNIPTGAQVDEYREGTYTNNYPYIATLKVGNEPQKVVQYNSLTEDNTWEQTTLGNLFSPSLGFNSPVYMGNSVTSIGKGFNNCTWLNSPIFISDSIANLDNCFNTCVRLNSPIRIGNNVISMNYCFYQCYNFNQPISLPNTVQYLVRTFGLCDCFNQPITIPNSVINMSRTFLYCNDLNQPITISNSVKYMAGTFAGCKKFNQYINIPDGVLNVESCFSGCSNLNEYVYFPRSVGNYQRCLENCTNFGKDILIYNNTPTYGSFNNMLGSTNNSRIKKIWCISTAANVIKYDVAGTGVAWDTLPDNNGYYNTAYNIYIYNNWTPS